MQENLNRLLQRPDIWQGTRALAPVAPTLATGYEELNARLQGGGWPTQGLTEILLPQYGIGELQLLLPTLASLSHRPRWLAWIAPPFLPYAPGLQAGGVRLERVLLLRPCATHDGWWATEQALRSGACSIVLSWMPDANDKIQRRLQLAADHGQTWGVVFRPASAANQASYAALRLRLDPVPGGITVHLFKQRGMRPIAPFTVRWQ